MAKKTDDEIIALFLSGAEDMLQLWEEASLEIASNQSPEIFEKLFRSAHNLKGGAGLAGLENYVRFIHSVEDFLQSHKAQLGSWSQQTLHYILKVGDQIRAWNEAIQSDPSSSPAELLTLSPSPNQAAGSATPQTEEKPPGMPPQEQAVAPTPAAAPTPSATPAALTRTEDTVRISTGKLDNIIKLMGELSLYQAVLFNSIEKNNREDLELLSAADTAAKLTEELHAEALSLRMFPLAGLFRKLERLSRDLSYELSKPVDFHTSGEDVTLDKLIIEGISDPLVHIIRNSLDHGLEDVNEREKLGKPYRGRLEVTATTEAHGATICIRDDGRGIDRDKVVAKAKSLGLVDEARAESMTAEDQINLIFLPGFSTAAKVTDLSGRGVGMDVLKSSVIKLGGSIKLESELGQGTTIKVHLPANLSILDALVVQSGGVQFAVPNQDLEEIINLSDYEIEGTSTGQRLINLRGSAVPVKTLDFLDRLSGDAVNFKPEVDSIHSLPCLVVRADSSKLAYAIDRIIGQQKIFVRPLNRNLQGIPYISGTTILTDGAPTMILNMNELIRDSLA